MTMLGGVELFAQTNTATTAAVPAGPKVKVAVIGLGPWGREILNTLVLIPQAEVVAICDTYAAAMKRIVNANPSPVPGVTQTQDYKTILANKDIAAVVVATPTHQHKEIVLAALKAGKHVYCEAPLAHTVADAKEIALAAKAAGQCVFQSGLQLRSDPQRLFLLPHIRSGGVGKIAMARSQFHKKQTWRANSPNPEREKEINWRLDKSLSLGLIGEIGIHAIDQASWFLNGAPTLASGFGSLMFHDDGRNVPDTVQAVIEYPNGVRLVYDATLANSFFGSYDMFYGSDAGLMLMESKAWMFKEVDSALGGWEVYAKKETFYKETGIVLRVGGSKSVDNPADAKEVPYTNTAVSFALQNFLRNAADLAAAKEDFITNYGDTDAAGLSEALAKVSRRASAGYQEGFNATVTVIKANEAIMNKQPLALKPEWYELG